MIVRISMPSAVTIALVLGARHLAERDQRRGGRAPAEQRAQRVGPQAMPSGSGSGWSRIPTFSRALEQLAELHHAAQVVEVRELVVDVVADQRAQPGRGAGTDGAAARPSRADPTSPGPARRGAASATAATAARANAASSGHERELVALLRVELRDRLGGEAALERVEAGRPGAGLVLAAAPR